MTATLAPFPGGNQRWVEQLTPNVQASTNNPAVVVGSEVDMRALRSLSYTITVAANTITWWVYGANRSDYADEVIVDGPSDVAAGAADSYAVEQAPYAYYRVKVESKVDGAHGNVGLCGLAKG
jgi:hypothetical protein